MQWVTQKWYRLMVKMPDGDGTYDRLQYSGMISTDHGIRRVPRDVTGEPFSFMDSEIVEAVETDF